MQPPSPALALRQARLHLLEHGTCPAGTIDERLARSWRRSLAAGLQPSGRLANTDYTTGAPLRHTLATHHELLAHSRPVMEYLFEQVRHSQSVVILADPRGTLMHTLGDAYFLERAERVALTCGASWHEAQRGTNAIGTALAEQHPVEIHGAEHFLERNGFLTCAAAPIMSLRGELLGVLDISGDRRSGHPHTLGLVNTAARMIENRLLQAHCHQQVCLHMHTSVEGIGTLAEGLLAVSHDGWIVGANRCALAWLGLAATDLGATLLEAAMDTRLETMLARHHQRPDQPLQVRLANGTSLFVQVQGSSPAVLPASSAPKAAPAQPLDALDRLDTGDARWRSAAGKARRIAGKPISLLIQGESGVGKELFARAVHAVGPRAAAPFVAINCAAIPENLIETELFGYAPGAFTGARREGAAGRLREAHGGTLFLDEIGDMPLALQSRLLRVLQDRQVTPVGGGKAVDVDFSLICATHRPLRDDAEAGVFREDLYYRLNGLTLVLPALRDRSDFDTLTARLLERINVPKEVTLAPDVHAALARHGWPGNLRQYDSVLRTASAMLEPGESSIGWQHLPDDLGLAGDAAQTAPASARAVPEPLQSQRLDALALQAIEQALQGSRGNVSQAARKLGISRQTLYRKLKH